MLGALRARQINVEPTAQSSNGVTVDVTGVALFKIGSEPEQVRRAAERFASQDGAIEQFTREQLEGSLRGVAAMLTVEQLMRDRQQLSDQIAENIKGDLEAQGLILDSFQIQGITAQREVQRNKIATDEQNLVEYTAYQKNTANAKAENGRANAEAEAAEKLARETLEQGVLEQAAMNQSAKLDAEVRRVAEAATYERQQRADAEAYEQQKRGRGAIRLAGEAKAAAIKAEAAAIAEHEAALMAQRAIEAVVPMMAEFAKGYQRVGSITVLGGEGGASAHLASEQAVGMRATFDAVKAATGVDLAAIIAGRAVGEGMRPATVAAPAPAATLVAEPVTAAGDEPGA
ncbi:flotillin family protein [Microbacterium sp. MEC084]|uniref:SPFH domain-containing protein n=1 Tax=Microbacterium sp. MEC084 TaxID=1963027 RepID=UPI00106F3DB6|nr:flotillin family protein [Microbacterium sp. MEC084]MCD1268350.1 flotillin family protein [Microbacterium sp. MEC084]